MKIAYVTTYDPRDAHAWSGLGNHILRALQDAGAETEAVGPLPEPALGRWVSRFKRAYYSKVRGQTYMGEREPTTLAGYAREIQNRLQRLDYEIVFSPGSLAIARVQSAKPIVFWTDATFAGLQDFYPGYADLCSDTVKNGHAMEQQALSNCRLAIYSSEWAASSALEHYEVAREKVKVVPFGPNLFSERDLGAIVGNAARKSFARCDLLFLGVDWERKGGEIALAVTELLNRRGLPTTLHLVGCAPPGSLPVFAVDHGFISKDSEAGRKHLENLLTDAHFLILPSRADCAPVVFAEASSFGLPSLATRVGGIPTVIRDGKNGHTFSLKDEPERYCDYIQELMSAPERYRELAASSFREYSERLNWSTAGRAVLNLLRALR
ncbi:MAG: glycosyltransferase family 4 protein [Chthoniobacterales bacterium]